MVAVIATILARRMPAPEWAPSAPNATIVPASALKPVAGRAGAAAGLNALAGTIVALGALGAHPGAGMRRASIVVMTETTLLPTYAPACTYRPPFLRLCLRRLRALGLPVTDEQIEGRYTRWSGDAVELRRGEILILEPPR